MEVGSYSVFWFHFYTNGTPADKFDDSELGQSVQFLKSNLLRTHHIFIINYSLHSHWNTETTNESQLMFGSLATSVSTHCALFSFYKTPEQLQHGRAATLSHSVPPVKTLTVVYRLGFVEQRDNRDRGPESERPWMEFPGLHKASSFLLWRGHGQLASFVVWPGRCTWMINAGLFVLHTLLGLFTLSICLSSLVYLLGNSEECKRTSEFGGGLDEEFSRNLVLKFDSRKPWKLSFFVSRNCHLGLKCLFLVDRLRR